MDRAPVSVAILLAAAACLADEPPVTAPAPPETATAPLPVAPADLIQSVARVDTEAAPVIVAEVAPTPAIPEPALADAPRSTPPTAEAAPEAVPTVEIKKVTDDTICRKERPTGSQIGVTRCYSRGASLKDDEQMRRDIDEMRARQNEQQAREAAAAMTRRRIPVQ